MEKIKNYYNFKRENKWLGIIDYKTLLLLLFYIAVIVLLLKNINIKLEYLVYIFITLTLPVFIIVFINIGNESVYDVIIVLLKYYIKRKIYVKGRYIRSLKDEIYKKM